MSPTVAVGIDLGTTYSCVAVLQNGRVEVIPNELGYRVTPSYVAFTDTERLVGNAAKNQAAMNPKNTIFDVKRIIGRKFMDETVQKDIRFWPFKVQNVNNHIKIKVEYKGRTKSFTPEEISSMVLMKMKETAETYLNQKVKDVVITVPAYFNELQKQATKDAGTIAGLNVLRIINEPTAAALAYGLDKGTQIKKNILVFDFGGGTLDVSIVAISEGSEYEVKATAGDTHLGGADLDNKIAAHFVGEFKREYSEDISESPRALRRMLTACEQAKIILSCRNETCINVEALFEGIDFSTKFTRARFEVVCADLLSSILNPVERALADAKLDKSEIDEVVLAGGSTRIPKVQNLLSEFFDGKQLNKSINPDEAIAYGAALQAAKLTGNMDNLVKDIILKDITPLSLGIEVQGKLMSEIVKRGTTIPTKLTKTFTTVEDYQTSMVVKVYEGERPMIKDNILLGSYRFTGILPALRGVAELNITFDINDDGILNVIMEDPSTRQSNKLLIKDEISRLSKEEIERMLAEAELFKEEDEKNKKLAEIRNKLEHFTYDVKRAVGAAGDKLSELDQKSVLEACDNAILWLERNTLADIEEIQFELSELQIISSSKMANLYNQGQYE
ncbi:heat shock 70 kDa protein-like [Biomphalaria glabrata]|uniref:Heat shock 70 kDa protein-like n=1 Tax=Biomphalaria glabrata TaxID=6526 RepID=A0A9W2ZEU6_BIOGL|nr:heat shock 70 kDa protein-like [Biomphalaria glabrata]XP_055873444.1 heat shock 70 kDa protein-like [Biomphalaria glabrata]